MDIPYTRGRVTRQAHVDLPEGTVEEEYARNGFSGRYAHLYRKHAPTEWLRIEGPLRPRAYDLRRLESAGNDWIGARRPLLENADVRIGYASIDAAAPYLFRNADGDEILFVHRGAGRLETDFGSLAYAAGDYLLLPRGVAYRVAPTSRSELLVIEAASEVRFPDRGMLGQHALFDPAVIVVPSPEEGSTLTPNAAGEYELRVQRQGEITRVFYGHNPHDVVGWKGTLAPAKLSARDIRPVSSDRYHLPPSAHTTFVMHNAVVCTFLPRPLENGDAGALKVPFYHSNIDFDEVLFYHAGEFFSRPDVAPGFLTFHPQGIHHGPRKGAGARSERVLRTEEIAVMIDTKRPLVPCADAKAIEANDYWRTFT